MSQKHHRLLTSLLVVLLAFLAVKAGIHFGWNAPVKGNGQAGGGKALQGQADDQVGGRSGANKSPELRLARPRPSGDPVPESDAMLSSLRERLDQPNTVPGEALLTFRNGAALERFTKQASLMGLVSLGTIPQLNAARVRYGTIEQLRDGITVMGTDYTDVEGNLWLSIPQVPPQPDALNQNGTKGFGRDTMSAINAVGDRTKWGSGVTVAVVDTGILAHPTFAPGQVSHLDLVNDGQAFNSHGTSVASLIGGRDPQVPGVAPGVRILDVRVADSEGLTVGSLLAQGIIAATDRGAQVINVSIGGYGDSALLVQAVNYASQHGAVVVAAAGNEAYSELAIPAAYKGVISVGSVDANYRQAYFSNSGKGLELTAPGVDLITAWDTNKIALASGTSQSSALVSAAAAAYIGWGVQPGRVGARLEADSRPTSAPSSQVGAGVLTIKPPSSR